MAVTKLKRRSFRTEREFGLIVGGVFTLLSSWWFYRGKFPSVAPFESFVATSCFLDASALWGAALGLDGFSFFKSVFVG